MEYKYDKKGKRYWEDDNGDRYYGEKVEGDKVMGIAFDAEVFPKFFTGNIKHNKPNDCRLYLTQIADGFSCSLCNKEYVLVS